MTEKAEWSRILEQCRRENAVTHDLAKIFVVIAYNHFEIVKVHPDDRAECFDKAYDRLRVNFLKLDENKSPRNYIIQMVKYAIKDFYKSTKTNKRSILRTAKQLNYYE
tara:strand:+ start:615 stop:938 length:324 start_codon:yes stop_codon:yes gene_type:complete